MLVDTRFEAADEEVPYGPLDTMLRFDMDMAARKLFPAVDPVYSTSALQEGAQLEAVHLAIQQRARKLLRRYRELRSVARAQGLEKLPELDKLLYRGAVRFKERRMDSASGHAGRCAAHYGWGSGRHGS